ncbi:hypothetical protein [Desulforamulus aquiferis]|uniref:YqzN/YkzM domain-containing protein n=1 Tax=Desulforamulus aquiferis TaxID=1397668 RepID=A0AAW7ZE34_9FIRM|nr:hypothetical protein [Desulforamulus aquiferis]MDO7787525.1 hypothetical protein [Desulforamulus aquiferis]RYD01639.1 hypothetical protein N752_29110 [Desulforamulus aquiferis]
MNKKNSPEQKYLREEIIENAEILFKVKPEVVIGALHNIKKHELTVSEVEQAVKLFLEEVVK